MGIPERPDGIGALDKTPALFFSLVIVGWAYLGFSGGPLGESDPPSSYWPTDLALPRSVFGLSIFALLKLHPALAVFFGRSDDFTFQVSEILAGEWRVSLDNLGAVYAGSVPISDWSVSLPFIAALVSRRREWHWRILAGA